MKIIVITSCTGKKSINHAKALTLADFKLGAEHVAARESELQTIQAEHLYTGQQHIRLMRGVHSFRKAYNNQHNLDLYILSAGYGLISGNQSIAPYETTFTGMKAKELRGWADTLGVPCALRKILKQEYDLALVLLGDTYLTACNFKGEITLGGTTLLLCGEKNLHKMPTSSNLNLIPLTNSDTTKFSCGMVSLKGEIASRILINLSKNIEYFPASNLLTTLDASVTSVPTSKKKYRPTVKRTYAKSLLTT